MNDAQANTLAQSAMRDLHPSWLANLDSDLVIQARGRALGRQWLADRLARTESLYRDLQVYSDALRPPHLPVWLFQPLPVGLDRALGAHAYAGLIKTSVARAQVAHWRDLLGSDLYTRVLNTPAEGDPGPVESQPNPRASDMGERLRRQGAIELYRVAFAHHPLAAERIQLGFPRDWALSKGRARLSTPRARAVIETVRETPNAEPAPA
ncbi:hypothetical protein [Saccharospirillum salsuginis]|uniref:Uncharacterized protein n=1 Tax=Saccharospirillum salsuginis TaxID=418750 RepID=A0A918KVM9_9GAMM|nr:hypothetical protein [Saccharospirillum salsuginis]GGX75318.1 hypothetical protein GCM10007392_48080 [Saccharospirillum salsuginis]